MTLNEPRTMTLRDVCQGDLQTGPFGSQLHAHEYEEHGAAVIMPKDIIDGRVNLSGTAKVNHRTAKRLEKHRLLAGDIIFSRRGDVARTALVTEESEGSLCGTGCLRARPSPAHNARYIAYQLQLNHLRVWLEKNAVGQTMLNLNTPILARLPIQVGRSRSDEDAAVAVLNVWDAGISALQRQIQNSESLKSTLTQQLVWGKSRFSRLASSNKETHPTKYGAIPGDWRFPKIAEFASEVSVRNDEGDDLPVLACSKYLGFVRSLDYFKKKVYSDDTSNYKIAPRGTFGFPANHIEEGSIGYQNICDAGLVSPIYCLFRTDGTVWGSYLYRLFKTDHYRQIFSAATSSSVDRRGSLRWNEFSKLHVPLPTMPEQKAISRVLDVADERTANLVNQLVNVRSQRVALMQQLLTGKRPFGVRDQANPVVAIG